MQQPLVSIILPVCNAESYLENCLESIKSQSYVNIEIVAIDDFSSDKSFKILKQWQKKDKRLKVFKNVKRYGLSVTLNRAIRQIKGTFITFMNPQDFSTPHRIKKQVQYLLNNKKAVAVGSQCFFVNHENKRIGKSSFPTEHENIYHSLLPNTTIQFETIMINKTLLPKDVLYFQKQQYPVIFTNVLMKILTYGEFANLPEYLHIHRIHASVKTQASAVIKHTFNMATLWVKSIAFYNYRPSLKGVLPPIAK